MLKVRDAHGWSGANTPAGDRHGKQDRKQLNIGMIGYGFMGRAHSNAYRKVAELLRRWLSAGAEGRAVRARDERPQAFADTLGLRVASRADWREADRAQGHRRHRHLRAQRPARRNRHRRGRGRQDGAAARSRSPAREAEGKPMVDAVEKAGVPNMVWYNYRRVPAVTLASSR